MTSALKYFISLFGDLWDDVFNAASFEMYGVQVTYGSVILVFILIAVVANVWWKGAHS